jgi:uncharacterized protein YxeA
MIKFFRKIRQRLLTENKFSKYLIYAIGEIILVVIGILIALQVNKLNENRKIDATRNGYYVQIQKDFEKDKNYIARITSLLDSNMVEIKAYEETFKQPNLPLMQIIQNLKNLYWLGGRIQFKSSTINTLQNSGDINLIPLNIRNKLYDLKNMQDYTMDLSHANNTKFIDAANFAALRYFGSVNLLDRMVNQPILMEYVMEKDNQIKIILALESAQKLETLGGNHFLAIFKKMLLDIDDLTQLINDELEK